MATNVSEERISSIFRMEFPLNVGKTYKIIRRYNPQDL
jgi:hypothetical protein